MPYKATCLNCGWIELAETKGWLETLKRKHDRRHVQASNWQTKLISWRKFQRYRMLIKLNLIKHIRLAIKELVTV